MTHQMVYFVSGDSYSDLHALRSGGIIDLHYVIHGGGSSAPAQVVADCNAAGLSPVLNNGNDGAAGWNGSDSYNANLAAQGWHAVGGESEQAAEIDSIMDHLIFLDYGGEGTAGTAEENGVNELGEPLKSNDCVWCATHPAPVHGHGAASYMETYDSATNFWGWNVLSQGVQSAKAHGVKEIGICVGTWMLNHSSAQDYINLAQAYEANGITCAGIGVWGGYNNNANNIYNTFASWFKAWQAIWPPTNVTMKNRFTGPTPTPGPAPPAHIMVNSSPAAAGGYVFVRGTDLALWWKTIAGQWVKIGGILTSAPCAIERGTSAVDVYARGNDGGLWHLPITAGKLGVWSELTGKILVGTDPVASANGDLYVIGTDHAVWRLSGGKWTSLGSVLK